MKELIKLTAEVKFAKLFLKILIEKLFSNSWFLVRGFLFNNMYVRDMTDKRGKRLLLSNVIYKVERMINFSLWFVFL